MNAESDNETLLKSAIANYFASNEVCIRLRPSSFARTSTHDARGDALSMVFESMIQSSFPLWAAYMLAHHFVDLYEDRLDIKKIKFSEDYAVINASDWCQKIMNHFVKDYMRSLLKGTLPLPKMPAEWNRFPTSVCSQRNRKSKMEDRLIVLPSLAVLEPKYNFKRKYSDAFFAVFDGHNGSECAAYASAHFSECLIEALLEETNVEDVLTKCFANIDNRISTRCKYEGIRSGTTASCVYLEDGKTAYIAWCGDSSIGVLHNKEVITISTPHKPEDPKEMQRIQDAGGFVISIQGVPRLNGVLNLSRSFGDICVKPMISSEPDASSYSLTDDDYMLFLASDGVWDSMDEEEVYECIPAFVEEHTQQNYEMLANFITGRAKRSGSCDNLTLICVFLKPIQEIWRKYGKLK